jgi:hypothetical protein
MGFHDANDAKAPTFLLCVFEEKKKKRRGEEKR